VVGLGFTAVVALVLLPLRDDVDAATPTAVLMVGVVLAAVAGGPLAAVVTALVAGLLLNLVFLLPYGTLKVRAVEDGIGLAAFVGVALLVALLVSSLNENRLALDRRSKELARALEERERLEAAAQRARELERIDDERSAVLRSVSHDLRTPLSAIRAIAGDLRDDVDYDDETRHELLTIVVDEADRLDRMVTNLLSISRIESGIGRPETAALDLGEQVAVRLRTLSTLLEPFVVAVSIPDDLPLVAADEIQIDQVLTNLLANAARHTPPGAEIRIEARRRGDKVRVTVSDEGPGVAPGDRARVFEPFQRGEGSRSSGLGLAISKAVVEAHGGSIWIGDRDGGGAAVTFTLPVIELPEGEDGAP